MNTTSLTSFEIAKINTIKNLIAANGGKIFSVEFKRKNPKMDKDSNIISYYATITGRVGVTKNLKGGVSTVEKAKENGLVIMDSLKAGKEPSKRSFYAQSVKSLKIAGKVFSFEENETNEEDKQAEIKLLNTQIKRLEKRKKALL